MNARKLSPAVLPGALSAVCGTGLLATSGWLITRASQRPPVLSLCVAIGAVQAFSLGKGIFRYFQRLGVHGLSLEVLGAERLKLFDLLESRVPGSVGAGPQAAALSGLVSDAEAVAQGFAKGLTAWVDVVCSALAGTVIAALVEPRLGLFVLAGALAVVATSLALSRSSTRAETLGAAERSALAGFVAETVRSARELVAYGREDLVEARLAEARRRSGALARRSAVASGLARAAATATTGGALVAVLGAGLAASNAGHLSGPLLAVAAFATMAALDQCAALPAALAGTAAGRASAQRISELSMLPAVQEPGSEPQDGAVLGRAALENAAVALPGGAGLKDVSLRLGAGDRLAICGASGAGKTTAINALLHFVECAGGRATLGGVDVKELTRPAIARRAAWLPDETYLFAANLGDNLRIARPAASDDECTDALRRAGLSEWYASLPEGLATGLGAGGRPVSGGERQRLGMARALLGGGPVLLLDEPTARLDPTMSAQVLSGLLAAAADRSVLVVTHEPGIGGLVDEVVVLAGGKVASRRRGHAPRPASQPGPP